MMHRSLYLALFASATLGCAASTAPSDEPTASTSARYVIGGGFPPPVIDLYIANVTVTPADASVTIDFTTGSDSMPTITVGTGDTIGGGTIVGTASDYWPSTDHHLSVAGLAPCARYWYRIAADGYTSSGRFTTAWATVEAMEVTEVGYWQARVHVRTTAPSSVTLNIAQDQDVKTDPDWSTTMSNPTGVEHDYFFALNGPRYVVEALPSSCGGWVPRWASFDHWPSEYGDAPSPSPTGLDFPRNRNIDYFHKIQGVAHGDGAWFVSRMDGIVKIPRTDNLDVEGTYPGVGIPDDAASSFGQSDHIGDVDFSGGFLYAPLETAEGKEAAPKVLFYDKDLGYLGWTTIAQGATVEIPWLAVNPIDGLLYTSVFNVSAAPGRQIRAYSIDRDGGGRPIGLTRDPSHDIVLRDASGRPMAIFGVQGGVFSPMGHLYLSVDAPNYKYFGGVMAFDVATGREKIEMSISYSPKRPFTEYFEEIEGIDIWDLGPGDAPGITGQVHVMMGKWTSASLWFKHFALSTNEGKWWL